MVVEGQRGRPRKTWDKLMRGDLKACVSVREYVRACE